MPCNQFKGQEPGTAEEIAEFCSATYGVTFPMTDKVEVNGPDAHPLYQRLTEVPDATRRGRPGPLELREVPARAERRGRRAVPAAEEPDAPELADGDRGAAGRRRA